MADLYFWASKLIGFFLEPLHALGLLTDPRRVVSRLVVPHKSLGAALSVGGKGSACTRPAHQQPLVLGGVQVVLVCAGLRANGDALVAARQK